MKWLVTSGIALLTLAGLALGQADQVRTMPYPGEQTSFALRDAVNAEGDISADDPLTEKSQAAAFLNDALFASRLPLIHAEMREAVRTVYLPSMQARLISRSDELTPEELEEYEALVDLLDYSLRAADELEPVLEAEGEAIIDDVAAFMADHMTGEQIAIAHEMLRTPAAHKGFNTLHAASRLVTDVSAAELRQYQELTAWMDRIRPQTDSNPFADGGAVPPPPETIAKAEAVIDDLMRVLRLDEMVDRITAFIRNVVLDVETLDDDERAIARQGLAQFEFFYSMGMSVYIAAAPSMLAASVSLEDLRTLHLLVLSPVNAKGVDLIFDVIRHGTSFTAGDIREFRALLDEAEAAGPELTPEDKAAAEADWRRLVDTWRARLRASMSPETRDGLDAAIEALEGREPWQMPEREIFDRAPFGERQL